jgi:molybdopterin-guanine dinucleotide biosynthesis protein A
MIAVECNATDRSASGGELVPQKQGRQQHEVWKNGESGNIAGIILAGGGSTRMGRDKALLEIGGRPLLLLLIEQMRAAGIATVIVSVGDGSRQAAYARLTEAYKDAVRFVHDVYPGCGPLAGLHAALPVLPEGYAFVMACDMPNVIDSLYSRMKASVTADGPGPDVIRAEGQPFHALYHTRIAAQLQEKLAQGDYRVMGLLIGLRQLLIEPTDGEKAAFINLNDPQAFAAYTGSDRSARYKA